MAKVICVTNQKGGVGKTTTAVNISFYLAKQKFRTLLIDFDPQGNATSGLGIDKNDAKVKHNLVTKSPPAHREGRNFLPGHCYFTCSTHVTSQSVAFP